MLPMVGVLLDSPVLVYRGLVDFSALRVQQEES